MQGRRYELRPRRTWAGVGVLVALATVLPGLPTLSGGAAAQSTRVSALTPGTEPIGEADLPSVLGDSDLEHYERIFRLQGTAQWLAADREIAALNDKLLIGTVQAQRYLHPAYRGSYGELSRWLARHAAEPDAKAIYVAALNRRPANAEPPAPAAVAFLVPRDLGEDSSETAALAHWDAGLTAWRVGQLGEARGHFQTLARTRCHSSWITAAAAFWAARVELRAGRPARFTYWLGLAAAHPHTFYGLLARHILGTDSDVGVDVGPFTALDAQTLMDVPAGRRALALLQLGETQRAEAALRALAPHASPLLVESLVALADRANMPALSLQLAGLVNDGAGRRHHALYPVPRWTPLGGFTVDRALLFAVMRQESQFATHVESHAGALGVMQLMPATAHAMARRAGVRLAARDEQQMREALTDPELNMALAQEYITELMENERIGDNLLLLAAAYNCGPGAAQRWPSDAQLRNDPLLFLESIPQRETRIFTERVLVNYWIYRQRLGQPTPDLDALAAGEWPTLYGARCRAGAGASPCPKSMRRDLFLPSTSPS